jgi:hypothetical protein
VPTGREMNGAEMFMHNPVGWTSSFSLVKERKILLF